MTTCTDNGANKEKIKRLDNCISSFPVIAVTNGLMRNYKNIVRCNMKSNIPIEMEYDYRNLLKGQYGGHVDRLRKGLGIYTMCNTDIAWTKIYVLVGNLLFEYLLHMNYFKEEPKIIHLDTHITREYILKSIYKLDTDTMNKLNILGEVNIRPENFYKLTLSDKIEDLMVTRIHY